MKKRICVFASGNGSNTEVLIKYFNKTDEAKVALVVSNNANAKVVSKAKNLGVNTFVFNKAELKSSFVLNKLKELRDDFIVLAGFLLLIPNNIINQRKAFRKSIKLRNTYAEILNLLQADIMKRLNKNMHILNLEKS